MKAPQTPAESAFEAYFPPLLPGLFWISGLREGALWGAASTLGFWAACLFMTAARPLFPKKVLLFSALMLLAALAQAGWIRFGFPPAWMLSSLLLAAPSGLFEKTGSFASKKKSGLPSGFWTKGFILLSLSLAFGLCREGLARLPGRMFFAEASGAMLIAAALVLAPRLLSKSRRLESRV